MHGKQRTKVNIVLQIILSAFGMDRLKQYTIQTLKCLMLKSIAFGKFGLAALLFAAGIIGGIVGNQMLLTKPIPDCVCAACPGCPQPTVSVQPFDVEKIKGLREFNYSPNYIGNIAVNGVDSSAVHKWIERSVMKAI